MKTISARQFRLTFQELTEPVSVTRRTAEGYVTVGQWVPASTYVGPTIATEVTVLDAAKVRTFRPVPKPGRTK